VHFGLVEKNITRRKNGVQNKEVDHHIGGYRGRKTRGLAYGARKEMEEFLSVRTVMKEGCTSRIRL